MLRKILRNRASRIRRAADMEALENRRLLSAAIQVLASPDTIIQPDHHAGTITNSVYTPVYGYSPSQIQTAYGFNNVTSGGVNLTGAGQTIAIVDAYNDPNLASDLKTFDSTFDLAAPPSFTQISQTGGAASSVKTDAGWALEESLDVEWAHAIAPGASIVVVEAKSDSLSDLLTAVNFARNYQNVSVVSMSWGSSEFSGETQYASDFTTPTGHIPETFVAASGDEGLDGGPEWPSSSASVLAVGGTSLFATDSGTYGDETAWGDSSGGVSTVVGEPTYQDFVQSTGARTTPDVSYDADPNTGFAVYDSLAYEGEAGWQEIGGTSAGAPQWGALVALADQGRVLNHLSTLDGGTQTLPTLYSIYAAPGSADYSTYASTFHDVGAGSSSYFGGASAGYDYTTGLGSPNAPAVVKLLIDGAVTVTNTGPTNAPPPSRHTFYRFAEQAPQDGGTVSSTQNAQPAVTPDAISAIVAPKLQISASPAPVVLPAVKSAAASIAHASEGSMWLETMGVYTADVAAITTTAPQTITFGAAHAGVRMTDAATAAATAAENVASPAQVFVEPHIWLQLAQLDAGLFADSLRAFAHESAALESAMPSSGWPRLLAAAAAAIMADAVVVGYWYYGRTRRKARSDLAAQVAQ